MIIAYIHNQINQFGTRDSSFSQLCFNYKLEEERKINGASQTNLE